MSHYETRAVLAAAYRRGDRRGRLTHTVLVDDDGREIKVVCGTVKLDSIADVFSTDSTAPPTCPRCLAFYRRKNLTAREKTMNRTHRQVADFNTLPDLLRHAQGEGATHVLDPSPLGWTSRLTGKVKLYFPRGRQYEEAVLWREHGYWHAPAPADREVVDRLPRNAETIDSYLSRVGRRAAEVPRRGRVRETRWVPPALASEGITPIMLEVVLDGMGEHAKIRPGQSLVYDRDGYAPLRERGYIVLKHAIPGLSTFGDYLVLTDKGADLLRRWRLESRNYAKKAIGVRAKKLVRSGPEPVDDPFYIIQGLYNGTEGYGAGSSFGFDDEETALREAEKLLREPWFEGDYVRVITRDGQLVWDSRGGERTSHGTWVLPPGLEARSSRQVRARGRAKPKRAGDQILLDAEKAGADHAHEQMNGEHFLSWVHDQVVEAEEMRKRDPSSVIPFNAKEAARRMLQQLGWDAKRELRAGEILELSGASGALGNGITQSDVTQAFYRGFDGVLKSENSRTWLAGEITFIHSNMGAHVAHEPAPHMQAPRVVRDYEGMSFEDWLAAARHGHSTHIRDDRRARVAFKNGMDPQEFAETVAGGFLATKRRPRRRRR
jgi:hypothetical protein